MNTLLLIGGWIFWGTLAMMAPIVFMVCTYEIRVAIWTYLRANIKYSRYVIRHKWFVLMEICTRFPKYFWRGLVHDNSKFLPSEWFPYVGSFCIDNKAYKDKFDLAWLKHQKRNPHHWQYWVLINDEDGHYALPMPYKYMIEMLCDWKGAGKAQGKGEDNEVRTWYRANESKMILHPTTKHFVEKMIGILGEPDPLVQEVVNKEIENV